MGWNSNGAQPDWTLAFAFAMVVVMGNAIIYQVCVFVAEYIGFKIRDGRETCYLILYVIACLFNMVLDMVVTYAMYLYILEGLGFRTYDGRRVLKIETFTETFESYGVQRTPAENVKTYSFPATFLIPFLIESS